MPTKNVTYSMPKRPQPKRAPAPVAKKPRAVAKSKLAAPPTLPDMHPSQEALFKKGKAQFKQHGTALITGRLGKPNLTKTRPTGHLARWWAENMVKQGKKALVIFCAITKMQTKKLGPDMGVKPLFEGFLNSAKIMWYFLVCH